MATSSKPTLADFLSLPDTEPASEYIDGEVVQKTMPVWDHGLVQRLLSFVFTIYLRAHPLGDAGPEIRCVFGPAGSERAYIPDYVFVRTERLQRGEEAFFGAPDLAVEILSPDDRMSRVMRKLRFYLAHGVRLVWLIDPDRRTITVMTVAATRILGDVDMLSDDDVLPGFSCAVRDLLPPVDAAQR